MLGATTIVKENDFQCIKLNSQEIKIAKTLQRNFYFLCYKMVKRFYVMQKITKMVIINYNLMKIHYNLMIIH
jgi:hypothetical protein